MDLPFAVGLFVAAVALTYFFCIRPMRRGQGHCGSVITGSTRNNAQDPAATRQRAEIDSLRAEIESLKATRR